MKKLVAILGICLFGTQVFADVTRDALLDVGIQSIREWSSCNPKSLLNASNEEYEQVFDDGWQHINIVICAQDDFRYSDSKIKDHVYWRAKNLADQTKQLLAKYPDVAIAISFKGYMPIGGWNVKGIRQTQLYKKIEESEQFQEEYIKWWKIHAQEFRSIDRVAFTIMNEPEWHTVYNGKRKWRDLALRTIDTIREVSPDRWIIMEGTNKSLIGRDWSAYDVMGKPFDRHNIIYGFHFYGSNQSGKTIFKNNPKEVVKHIPKSEYSHARRAMQQVIDYGKKYNVPVSITEFGMTGEYAPSGGVDLKLRAHFVQETLGWYRETCDYECGITWWALGDYNTPYIRNHSRKPQYYPRVPDTQLNTVLKLKEIK